MLISLPKAFRDCCRNLGQDLARSQESAGGIAMFVDHALVGLDQRDAAEVRDFARAIIDQKLSDEELQEFWWSTPASIYFHRPRDVEAFLLALEDRLNKPPFSTAK